MQSTQLAAHRCALGPASAAAVEYLATRGYDPAFGARPVKRVVQQELETALAKGILRGDFAVSACCCLHGGQMVVRREGQLRLGMGRLWVGGARCRPPLFPLSGSAAKQPRDSVPSPRPQPQEEDTVVVEAPGGAKATHLVVYRKGAASEHRVEQGDNAAELAV